MDVHEVLAVVVSSRRSTDTARDTHQVSPFASASPFSSPSKDMDLTAPVAIPRGHASLDIAKPPQHAYSLSRMLSGTLFPGSLARTSTSSTATGRTTSPYSPSATFGGNSFHEGGWWPADKEEGSREIQQDAFSAKPRHTISGAGAGARSFAEQSSITRGLVDFDAMYHMDLDRHSAPTN